MLGLVDYTNSDSESSEPGATSNEDVIAHLKPIDPKLSIAKTLTISLAPNAVPTGSKHVPRAIDPKSKELTYNPRYEELCTPVQGPENPNLTQQMRAPKNVVAGFLEKAHISEFEFENQRRTFHSFGYALDPSTGTDGKTFVGHLQDAYDTNGKTVFEKTKIDKDKETRKRLKNDVPEDVEGFSGPWARYENEQRIACPNEQERAEIEEMMAKKNKRHKISEDAQVEEKTILHIKDAVDYQGRSFLHPPHDVGTNLRPDAVPDRCYLPKAHIHTWQGHTKGVSAIKFFPKSAHLLLSCSMDTRVKLWEIYGERRCIRTYSGHRQAVRDIDFNINGTKFLSAGYDRYIKLWDTETGDVISRFSAKKIPFCVKFHPDFNKQHLFVAGTSNKKIICVSILIINHHTN